MSYKYRSPIEKEIDYQIGQLCHDWYGCPSDDIQSIIEAADKDQEDRMKRLRRRVYIESSDLDMQYSHLGSKKYKKKKTKNKKHKKKKTKNKKHKKKKTKNKKFKKKIKSTKKFKKKI